MLLNPYRDQHLVRPILGTRLLEDTLGVVGAEVDDPKEPRRRWRIQSTFTPLRGRVLGGIRTKLVDRKGFVTFCNQRDLEVLLGLEAPGNWCTWAGHKYVGPDDREWIGFCSDEDDLLDDLQERELNLRGSTPGGVLVPPLEVTRRVHLDQNYDVEDLFVFVWDFDPETGFFPDPRFETIEKRWSRAQREKVRWSRI